MATWPRPIVHWEIQGRDAEKLRAFYGTMFEWEMTPGPIPSIVSRSATVAEPRLIGPVAAPATPVAAGSTAPVVAAAATVPGTTTCWPSLSRAARLIASTFALAVAPSR